MELFGKKEKLITDYRIIIEEHLHSLERNVNEHIRNGWQPLGGISSSLNGNHIQAMVKYR